MIKFYKNLYISDSIHHVNRIKWKLRTGTGQLNIYLVTISNSSDQLECFHNSLLKQPIYHKLNIRVVGIASGYDEAIAMIQLILNDVLTKTGNADMKTYLLNHFSESE